jgi:hypothetical protein
MNLKKSVAGLVLGATLVGGGVTVAAIGIPGAAGAQGGDTAAVADTTGRPQPPAARVLHAALDALVLEGTITQEQADAVAAEVEAEVSERRDHWQERRQERAQHAADWLGITVPELIEALQSGQSLTEVADAQGKTRDELVAALNAAVADRVAVALAAGEITEDEAAAITERAASRIEEAVDRPGGPHRPGRPFPRPGS